VGGKPDLRAGNLDRERTFTHSNVGNGLGSAPSPLIGRHRQAVWKTPTFIHLLPSRNSINLAYRIEATAILLRFPKLLLSERFTKYAGGLANEELPSDYRDAIIAECVVNAL
jgi:hypothetical protein